MDENQVLVYAMDSLTGLLATDDLYPVAASSVLSGGRHGLFGEADDKATNMSNPVV